LSSDERSNVELTAVGRTPTTEVVIRDARFQQLDLPTNSGTVRVELSPGLYTISFREGGASVEKMATLLPESGPVVVEQDEPASYSSAAPISTSATTHEWHEAPARNLSTAPPSVREGGCDLVVLVRDIGDPVLEVEQPSLPDVLSSELTWRTRAEMPPEKRWPTIWELGESDPTVDLALYDFHGAPLAHVEPIEPKARIGGLRAQLAPGTYWLSVNTGTRLSLGMSVFPVNHVQTQVFLLCRDYGRGRRADLDSASVSIDLYGAGFDPQAPGQEQSELALQALAARRPLRGPAWGQLLRDKFQDPMLGVYGAHLLLIVERPNVELFDTVVRNTRSMIGDHPDLEAARLRRALVDETAAFDFEPYVLPPMLAASWDAVVAATRRDPNLVPAGSPSDLVADRITRSGPWLVWSWAPLDYPFRPPIWYVTGSEVADLSAALHDERLWAAVVESPDVTAAERSLATAILPEIDPSVRKVRRLEATHVKSDERGLSATLNLPVNSVRRLATNLLSKLQQI
jgi:hypothetical protein